MLFLVFQWIWLLLLVGGVALMALRPVLTRKGRAKPFTPRAQSWLWFLQALGFWCAFTGTWMKVEAVLPDLLEKSEEEQAAEEAEDDADPARDEGEPQKDERRARRRGAEPTDDEPSNDDE